MLVHDGEQTLKEQLTMISHHDESLVSLQQKITEYHNEAVAYNAKVNSLMGEKP
jgi:hypothetical protein